MPKEKKRCVATFKFKITTYFYISQCVDAFVDELRWEEQDLAKRDKLCELKLSSEEWAQVNIFLGLLSVCDDCDHFYSYFDA